MNDEERLMWLKEIEKAKHGNYDFHKYTDEYGDVITVEDVLSTLEKYINA